MPFPINVDNLFTFKDQCEQASGALHTADGDTVRASSIVGQQEALLVDPCQHDLQIASAVCEEISNDLKALTNAVSELAWSMKSVREEYKGIAQKAQDCGLIVEGDTVTLFDESDDDLVHSFNELQAQAEVQRLNYERAEHVFSLALDSLKVDTYEQWIEPVFNGLKASSFWTMSTHVPIYFPTQWEPPIFSVRLHPRPRFSSTRESTSRLQNFSPRATYRTGSSYRQEHR